MVRKQNSKVHSSGPELLTTIASLNVIDSKLQKFHFIKQNSKTPLVYLELASSITNETKLLP
jgi:hypothetical protein